MVGNTIRAWLFTHTFSRAEIYGLLIAIFALGKGADALATFVAFAVWGLFANLMRPRGT